MIVTNTIEEFLDRLASAEPAPGGGSAAAIIGAMAAALVSMVCNVSIGKKGYEAAETEMRAVLAEAEALRARLTAMVADDVAAFEGLMAAYRLPKLSDEDKARRSAAIQASLQRATEVPLECARACAAVIGLAQRAGERGYHNVISDAGAGVLAAQAALRTAALNVHVNAPLLKDRAYAEAASRETEALAARCAALTEAVCKTVRERAVG